MASYEQLKNALNKGSVGSALGAAAGGKKKKGGGFFSEKWQPPHRYTDDNGKEIRPPAEPIALIKGEHTIKAETKEGEAIEFEYPFWVYYDHYNGSKGVKRRSCSCSSGLVVDLDESGRPDFSYGTKPCIPCHYIDEEGAGGNDGYLNRGRKVVFTAVVLKWFHLKKDGKNTGFEDCTGRSCKLCEAGAPRQFGRRVFWPMGPVWAEYIFEKNATLQSSCGCGGNLEYLGFTCPECRQIIADYEHEPPKDGEIDALKSTDIDCPHCDETVRAHAELDCDECDSPSTVDLWSVVLKPVRIGEKYSPDLEAWRPIKDKEIEALAQFKPVDFSKFLSPSKLEDQVKWYGLNNPFDKDSSGSSEW